MTRYIMTRMARSLLTLLAVAAIIFFLSRLSGDAVELLVPSDATQAEIEAIKARYGLDLPLIVQFGNFLLGAVTGDMGISIRYGSPVLELILTRLPNTFLLAGSAIVLAVAVGVPMGLAAAYRPGRLGDFAARALALGGQSVPTFVVGLVLVLVFAIQLRWLPSGNFSTWAAIILPAITLAWFATASIIRITRTSVLDALSSQYVIAARARGASRLRVLTRHALRNTLTAILTITALEFVLLAGGAIVVESIFNWPGIGLLMVDAAFARDYPLLQGLVLFTATMTITVGLVTDVAYTLLDKRIVINE